MTGSGVEYRTNPRFMPDNVSIKFGTGGDSRIYYDGTDLVISPAEVGAGDLKIGGASLLLDSGEKIDFGAGDVTLTHAANKLTLGGGDLHVANGFGLVIGHTAQVTASGLINELEVLGSAGPDSHMTLGRFSADASGPGIVFTKGRDSIGVFTTAVVSGDALGRILATGADTGDAANVSAEIRFEAEATFEANDVPGRILFLTTLDGAFTPTERLRLDSSGGVFIGETANAKMTVGLTINQGANDDEILALKSSDVAHPITDDAEADTYALFKKAQSGSGGVLFRGFKDSGGVAGLAIQIEGTLGEAADTTKTTAGFGVVAIDAYVTNGGTSRAEPAADGNLLVVRAGVTTRFIFDTEGSAHADLEWTTFDAYDDLAVISGLEAALLDRVPAEQRALYEETGIIGRDSWHVENGKLRAMVNTNRLAMLHHGALMQVGERLAAIEERIGL